MKVDAFLADTVEKVNGKLYVLGAGWNVIFARRVPVRHPRVGIGVLIRVPYTETGINHSVSVRLEDADGRVLPIADMPGRTGEKLHSLAHGFKIGRPDKLPPGTEQIVPLAINIVGLVFSSYGNFRFVITVDEKPVALLPLTVTEPDRPEG